MFNQLASKWQGRRSELLEVCSTAATALEQAKQHPVGDSIRTDVMARSAYIKVCTDILGLGQSWLRALPSQYTPQGQLLGVAWETVCQDFNTIKSLPFRTPDKTTSITKEILLSFATGEESKFSIEEAFSRVQSYYRARLQLIRDAAAAKKQTESAPEPPLHSLSVEDEATAVMSTAKFWASDVNEALGAGSPLEPTIEEADEEFSTYKATVGLDRFPCIDHIGHIRSEKFMENYLESIMVSTNSPQDLEKKKLGWQRLLKAWIQMKDGVNASAKDLTNHVAEILRRASTSAANVQAKAVQQAIAKEAQHAAVRPVIDIQVP